MKKLFTYNTFLTIFLCFIVIMAFCSLLRHHYLGGNKLQIFQKIVVAIAETPSNARDMIKYKTINLNKQPVLFKHKDKKRFELFIDNKRNAILVLPRYDHALSRSVIDIVDLNNFEVIHTYKSDIKKKFDQIKNIKEYPYLKTEWAPERFSYVHPIILEDGSLIAAGINSPIYKIDFCSNLQWLNDKEQFHHSIEIDHENNLWTGGIMVPYSQFVEKFSIKNFQDDSIIKMNIDGKILLNKSVTELLFENNLIPSNFPLNTFTNPIHLNDVEPVLNDTKYWQQGDLFLSIKNQSAIVHYRPSTNKVLNYLVGSFHDQHDVDIISDKEISIFNNNNFYVNNEFSEVIIYNFETKTFRKLFNDQLRKENFKTVSQGLSHTFEDGALLVEEQNHGRIILLNNQGNKEWEFVNKDKNGDIGHVDWVRVIEDKIFIEKFKSLVKNKKCLN